MDEPRTTLFFCFEERIMSNKRVLITGVGGVGVFASHLVGALPGVELYLGDIREDYITFKANSVKDNAFYSNDGETYPVVEPVKMNLMDVDATTKQLSEIRPDVIIHLASLLAAQKIRERLPVDIAKTIYDPNPVGTGLRPWAPGHAVLLTNLMRSVKASGIETHVINGSGCDFLHVALSKYGLAPTCGLGDFALIEPSVTRILAKQYSVSPRDITMRMAGHHSIVMPLSFFGETSGVPYYIDVTVNGRNVSQDIDFEKDVFPNIPKETSWPTNAQASDQEQTAAHAVRIAKAILFDTQEMLNVPAPQGLPGCYPARVGAKGVEVVIPEGTTLEELVAINNAGNVAEGFQEIREDGTMVATERTVELVEKTFGIEWKYKEFTPDNAQEAFNEINSAFWSFIEKFEAQQAKEKISA
ncbi:hypothetical protein ABXV24_13880 [Vibrio owensii]|uniref:hypothetical protein n=2 Tax=Vibrio owensii TaxID=696485 RepID=UPI003396354B